MQIKPATWMGQSKRVIITPVRNVLLGVDAISQALAKANIVQQVWTAQVGIAAALGFQWRYPGLIWCSEVA